MKTLGFNIFEESMKGVTLKTIKENTDYSGTRKRYMEAMSEWWELVDDAERLRMLQAVHENLGAQKIESINY